MRAATHEQAPRALEDASSAEELLWGGPIVLFDGECGLCEATVRFITRRDPRAAFRFAPLQSAQGRRLLRHAGLPEDELDTVVLLEGGGCYTRSTAALRIARRLRFPWPLLYPLVLVPRPLRDGAYGFVARRRHRWRASNPAGGARVH